jgi:hypothetical protein
MLAGLMVQVFENSIKKMRRTAQKMVRQDLQ